MTGSLALIEYSIYMAKQQIPKASRGDADATIGSNPEGDHFWLDIIYWRRGTAAENEANRLWQETSALTRGLIKLPTGHVVIQAFNPTEKE